MNLDFFNNLNKNNNSDLYEFSSELTNFLNNTLSKFNNGDSFTIDRFENNFAVLEKRNTNTFINIPISKIPNDVKEGDILVFHNSEFLLDVDKTKSVNNRIENKFDRLKKK